MALKFLTNSISAIFFLSSILLFANKIFRAGQLWGGLNREWPQRIRTSNSLLHTYISTTFNWQTTFWGENEEKSALHQMQRKTTHDYIYTYIRSSLMFARFMYDCPWFPIHSFFLICTLLNKSKYLKNNVVR
jgi:hypothetical protein